MHCTGMFCTGIYFKVICCIGIYCKVMYVQESTLHVCIVEDFNFRFTYFIMYF